MPVRDQITAGSPGKPFVLLSKGRSGTNFLISKLQLTRQVLFGWEPFNQTFFGYGGAEHFSIPPKVMARLNDTRFRDADPAGYIDYCAGFTGALDGSGVKASAFKIFPVAPHNPEIYWKMTQDTRFRALVLERRSTLAVYSSLMIALKTNQWISRAGGEAGEAGGAAPEQVQIPFRPKEFEAFRKVYRETFVTTEANLAQAGVEHLKIYYEDLVSDPQVFASILAFLRLDPVVVASTWVKKQNDSNVLNRFTNPEVAAPYLEQEQQEEALWKTPA
ncbi:MAG: hypothetical protein U1D06_12340 [Paracoccaceae bacterium]|nr:hypothetical protein [Paracoccaceae bacterium]